MDKLISLIPKQPLVWCQTGGVTPAFRLDRCMAVSGRQRLLMNLSWRGTGKLFPHFGSVINDKMQQTSSVRSLCSGSGQQLSQGRLEGECMVSQAENVPCPQMLCSISFTSCLSFVSDKDMLYKKAQYLSRRSASFLPNLSSHQNRVPLFLF